MADDTRASDSTGNSAGSSAGSAAGSAPGSAEGSAGFGLDDLLGLIGLVGALNPVPAVRASLSQAQRGVEELITAVARFNDTMEQMAAMAARVNRLLDDAEPAIRAALPQVARSLQTIDLLTEQMGTAVGTLGDLASRLGPLGQVVEAAGGMFGLNLKKS